jgi:transaldolase/glucose-6-phosphate isomerase
VLRNLLGKVAIANAKLAYGRYQDIISGQRWQALAAKGAQTQRLLWASTGAKNPAYRDVVYVEELIGPDTVNTVPVATFESFRDHGQVRPSLEEGADEAVAVMAALKDCGISITEVTDQLQADAVRLFVEPFDKLLAAIDAQRAAAQPRRA